MFCVISWRCILIRLFYIWIVSDWMALDYLFIYVPKFSLFGETFVLPSFSLKAISIISYTTLYELTESIIFCRFISLDYIGYNSNILYNTNKHIILNL